MRSFVFVSDVGEVTKFFKDADVDEAIDLATAGKAVSLHSNSNYGRALASFARDELGSLGRRTTLMVIGDGRNNYNPSNVWALKDLKRKVATGTHVWPKAQTDNRITLARTRNISNDNVSSTHVEQAEAG